MILVCTLPKILADSLSYFASLGIVFDTQLKNSSLKAFLKAFLSFKVSDMSTFCSLVMLNSHQIVLQSGYIEHVTYADYWLSRCCNTMLPM